MQNAATHAPCATLAASATLAITADQSLDKTVGLHPNALARSSSHAANEPPSSAARSANAAGALDAAATTLPIPDALRITTSLGASHER